MMASLEHGRTLARRGGAAAAPVAWRRRVFATAAKLSTVLSVLAGHPAAAQWQVTAFLGDAATSVTAVTVTDPTRDTAVTLERVRFDDASFEPPLYYGGRLTRFFTDVPWLGVETEFIHAKAISRPTSTTRLRGRLEGVAVDADRPLNTVVQRLALSHGLNFLLANAVLRVRPGGGDPRQARVLLTGRVGVGPTLPHLEADVNDARVDEYRRGRLAWQAAAGAEWRIADRLLLVGELKWTRTRQRLEVGSSELETTLGTRHAVGGLAWRF